MAAANTFDVEQFKMTSLAELDARLGKLIKPGMTILITKDIIGHRMPIGTSCEVVKVNRPGRYNTEITYTVRNLASGGSTSANVGKGEFKLIGVQRATINTIVAQLDKERAAFASLLETMDGYGLTKDTDYVDVRKELIKKVYAEISATGVDEATKVNKIVELVDILSI